MKINAKSLVDTVMSFRWDSSVGRHEENFFCKINVWRDADLLPRKVKDKFLKSSEGDEFAVALNRGEIFSYKDENVIKVAIDQFQPPVSPITKINPRLGRFYPLGYFTGIEGVFPQNIKPVRIIDIDEKYITIDKNVPISKYNLDLSVKIQRIIDKSGKLEGECKSWCEISLENGPGMQVPYNDDKSTDFQLQDPQSFSREDEADDTVFYSEPRLTTHIDSKAHEHLLNLYKRILPQNGRILDLMSSYQSHIPGDKNFYEIVGLGLNKEELRANPLLNEIVIHDINKEAKLPLSDEEFDCVVCDLSIEYMIRPLDIISEIKRVLKKDGIISISFSNRYFPPKVIKLWKELHDFERIGYVLELLSRTHGFKDFQTFSYRGWIRPFDDKYFGSAIFSDPLFVVTAKKS